MNHETQDTEHEHHPDDEREIGGANGAAESVSAGEKVAQTTDADRTATSTPDGAIDEAGEDEQVGDAVFDQLLDDQRGPGSPYPDEPRPI